MKGTWEMQVLFTYFVNRAPIFFGAHQKTNTINIYIQMTLNVPMNFTPHSIAIGRIYGLSYKIYKLVFPLTITKSWEVHVSM